jgi:peptidoglycan/xylan/chitin deacetylase (PgdA/CDA1 family)
MLGLLSKLVFLGAAQRRLLRHGTPVFTYHRISASCTSAADPYLYVSPERLDNQLRALGALGYESGNLEDLTMATDLRRAVITFDDAFASVLKNGMEPLARNGFRAIQFVIARNIGGQNDWDVAKGDVSEPLMDVNQIKDWLAAGHAIGSHSMTHPNLRHISDKELATEVRDSRKLLEDIFGIPVNHFCYPYGSYNEKVREAVCKAGYTTACTVKFGVNNRSISPFEIRRIIPLGSGDLAGKILHRLLRKTGR